MAALGAAARSASVAVQRSSGALVLTKGRAVKQVAADGHRLVWETGPLEGVNTGTALFQRKDGGRARLLARNVNSNYGLAVASGWIVYAEGGARTRLAAVRPDGSRKIVLARWLAAPFAARGKLVAWIDQAGQQQRVVVRDMATGRLRVVARPRRCQDGHCYQVEQIALADRGVVFTRDSTGPDLSLVVRIRFSTNVRTRVQLHHDPQPNLVPSSAGALYYVLGRGWYRWDFGGQPRRTVFRANPPSPLLGYERGRWLLATRRGCDFTVTAVDRSGRHSVIVSPRRLKRVLPAGPRRCVILQAASWLGRQPLTAWAVIPRNSSEEHSDEGLFGVAFAGHR